MVLVKCMKNNFLDSKHHSLEETVYICINELFKNSDIVHDLETNEVKGHLSLATKDSYFIFNNVLCKHIDRVAKESSLGPSLAHTFLGYHEQDWSDRCPLEYRPLYYPLYVDDIFVF